MRLLQLLLTFAACEPLATGDFKSVFSSIGAYSSKPIGPGIELFWLVTPSPSATSNDGTITLGVMSNSTGWLAIGLSETGGVSR
jgi:hypothetical protein